MKNLLTNYYLLIAILIIAAFLRLYNITPSVGGLPPGLYPDEAMNGNNALEALATSHFQVFYSENNGREGLFMNIQAISIAIFGNQPWALRIVSAIFGILTVLGVYFLAKELFRENSKHQALNSKQIPNPNAQNSKQFGIGDWGFGISRSEAIALLSSFLLATSFWHINFSRIGFRAIMAPFFLIGALYFLIKAIRREKYIASSIIGGIFFGLGFYSYIAYRVMPLLILITFLVYWIKNKDLLIRKKIIFSSIFFAIMTFIVALPIGIYFLKNPQDFFGRTSEIAISHTQSPLRDLALNTVKTLGMFNFVGDWNWRHNYSGRPELFLPVGIMFVFGIILEIIMLWRVRKKPDEIQPPETSPIVQTGPMPDTPPWNEDYRGASVILLSWFILAMLPVVISNEGLPHALRSILMLPPAIIFAAVGGITIYEFLKFKLQTKSRGLKVLNFIFAVFLLILVFEAYFTYFILWGKNENVQGAFAADYARIGREFNELPVQLPKYVIVEASGIFVRGLPMPAQTIMFITDTFTPEKQKAKNIYYVLPEQANQIPSNAYAIVIK